MDIQVLPTLIDMMRETFEGEVVPGQVWITDPGAGLFDSLKDIDADKAFAPPVDGARPIAAHVAHLRFALDLMLERWQGKNPPADWASSFDIPPASPAAWEGLQRHLRRAYDAMLALLEKERTKAPQDLPPINLVGLSALIGHNAYHLGAIRQIRRVVLGR